MQASQRTVFSAPALVRLLARVSRAEVTEPGQSAFERLREWLRWTDAIALSNVLDAALPASASASASRPPNASDAETRLCAEARTALARAITEDSAFMLARQAGRPGARTPVASAPESEASDTIDYGAIRQHYLSMQQMMEARIADLRDRVRQRLAACSAPMARLAAIDEIMERALGEREHALLSTVPTLLESHFKSLKEAEPHASSGTGDVAGYAGAAAERARRAPGAWFDVFRADMQSALHAELAIRFQPVEGLLAALRDR